MVIGVLLNVNNIESILNNLFESDFSGQNISVIANDENLSKKLTNYDGPLGRIFDDNLYEELISLGLKDNEVSVYQQVVSEGGILVAIKTDAEAENSAKETLEDYNASNIKVLPET